MLNKLIIAALCLMVCFVAFAVVTNSTADSHKPLTTNPMTGQPAKSVPVIVISAENKEPAKHALDALFKLHSVTEAGLNLMQYQDQTLAAKVDFDSAMRSFSIKGQPDVDFTKAVNDSMSAYLDAKTAWEVTVRNESGRFYPKDLPSLSSRYDLAQKAHTEKGLYSDDSYEVLHRDEVLNIIWQAAEKHTADAQALLPH